MADTSLNLQGRTYTNLSPLQGGRNNRVFHAFGPSGNVLIKQYFFSPSDKRDRLTSEFLMLSFLREQGVMNIPEPILSDTTSHTGIYQFIQGSHVDVNAISEQDVILFSELLNKMYYLRNAPDAQKLPQASEACFSIKEYVLKIKKRFALFSQLVSVDSITTKMSAFILDNLLPFLNKIVSQVESNESLYTKALHSSLHTLSPSDHGFHNAIRNSDGMLYFIDFEYAGWDDPVKMVCDALLQPDKPVPEKFYPLFLKNVEQVMDPIDHFTNRIEYVYPLLGIKWCLIMLNEFLPSSESRRKFAGKHTGTDIRLVQLERSMNLFDKINEQFNKNYIVRLVKNSV
jgi:hypothetical protein